jgi:hypothetical protein
MKLALDLIAAIAVIVAILFLCAVFVGAAAAPACTPCPSHAGKILFASVLGVMAGGSIAFVAAGLFASAGRGR